MTSIINKLLPDSIRELKPYESARRLLSGGKDWLNANESPYANAYTLDTSTLNRYPECQPEQVIKSYADYAGIQIDNVLATRGADEGIELLIRTFCMPGKDSILICPPTYGMYAISAKTCNVGVQEVPLNIDFSLDVEGIKARKGEVNIVFICSPNNPTGTGVNADDIEAILTHYQDSALVVVDEAYVEFSPTSEWASTLKKYENLVVLRTLSKAFALAGLRCGFTLANPATIQALLKVIAPYPISAPVAQIAEQALSPKGISIMKAQVRELQRQQIALQVALSEFPQLSPVGSTKANFLLYRCNERETLMPYLIERGILLRDQSKQRGLDNCIRVSVGNAEQNQRLVEAITAFYASQEVSS
ncbi:histidinol-phosphate transaminase [Aestuariibacter sp. AA17]|uniref:Histidinol-phosphate aminotransferase n=1 Tax=Fluctibacter corallii TaxID=2984329 RepID=A0ABT3A8T7_9ALTE|nr:histidinol-phosphate transaminase [Aestuariibacter sp. AA17]MCV2885081.1 histidinol-phosphate transaminase [Aestuariibacter sp. AA17]